MARKRKKRTVPQAGLCNSFLFKIASKSFLTLVIAIAFLTLVQCTVKKPQAPQWNSKLTVPLVNRTYSMEELIRKIDQEGIGIDSTGAVTFSITNDLDTVRLEKNLLSTPDLSYNVSQQVGTVSLVPPNIALVSIGLSTIGGLSSSLPGDSAFVVGTSFDLYNDMPPIPIFSQATISNGQVDAVIDNNLGFSLDTVIVELYDIPNATSIAIDTFPQAIPSGSSLSLPISLSGKTLSGSLRLNTHCYTPGGYVDSVSSRYVSTALVFNDSLEVSSATAEIPALSRSFSQNLALSESDRIDTASLSGGNLNLIIVNSTNLDVNMTFTVPDIVSSGGQPLTINRPIPAKQNVVDVVNMNGYRLVPSDRTVPQEITFNVNASTPGTGSQQVDINQSDSFSVQANLDSMTFSSITGVFDSAIASFDSIGQNINVPTGFDSLQFVSATLTLEIENGIDLPGYLNIQLLGDNGKTLDFSGNITASGRDSSTLSTISDSSVANFLSPLPSHIDISGSVIFGDGVYQGTVKVNDYVFARVKIFAPLELVVNATRIETGIESQIIDTQDISSVTDHFIEGYFVYNIINHLPLGANVSLFFGGDSTTLYTNPIKSFDSLFITAAPVSASGIVIDTVSTGYQKVYLDSADVRRILENDTLYIGPELLLESTNGKSVKLTQDDFITVIGRIEVEYRFDGKF